MNVKMLPLTKMFIVLLCINNYLLICRGDSDVAKSRNLIEKTLKAEKFFNEPLKLELVDGVIMTYLPEAENRSAVFNFKMNAPEFRKMLSGDLSESRGSGGGGMNKKFFKRILPLLLIPILIQSALVPLFLSSLKMMLMKSMMIGKLALLLIGINALRTSNVFRSRSEETLADKHYGFHGSGMEEFGSFFNGRDLFS